MVETLAKWLAGPLCFKGKRRLKVKEIKHEDSKAQRGLKQIVKHPLLHLKKTPKLLNLNI